MRLARLQMQKKSEVKEFINNFLDLTQSWQESRGLKYTREVASVRVVGGAAPQYKETPPPSFPSRRLAIVQTDVAQWLSDIRTDAAMSSVQKKTTRTTKTVTTKTTQQVQSSSSLDQSDNVQSSVAHNVNNLSITKKGQFFNDSYFEDARQDFQDAIQDVLTKWGDKSKPANDINSYRELRQRDLRDENQAIKSTEDQRYHKVNKDMQSAYNGSSYSTSRADSVDFTCLLLKSLDRSECENNHQRKQIMWIQS